MAFRDNLASSAASSAKRATRWKKAPNRGCWFLIGKKDGKPAVSDRGTTAFNVKVAIQLLERLSVDATPGNA